MAQVVEAVDGGRVDACVSGLDADEWAHADGRARQRPMLDDAEHEDGAWLFIGSNPPAAPAREGRKKRKLGDAAAAIEGKRVNSRRRTCHLCSTCTPFRVACERIESSV